MGSKLPMSGVVAVYYQRCVSINKERPSPLLILHTKSLARLGARTIGIDPSESNVMIARRHAAADPALSSGDILQYKQTSAEELLRENKQYDIVCSMEVLEHVDNPKDFLRSCAGLVKVIWLYSYLQLGC
jgi:2-polyprenyl-3-methyl-5-hydroxy-6-metoxy-1,4-benzoquinol methylase